jgi:hypothetical protein
VASTLSRWLGTLDARRLARLLALRPESLTAPLPRTLGELAGRLQGRFGVIEAFGSVPLPAVQVLETVSAFDCRTRADLADLLGEDGLDEALATLTDRALLWEYDGLLAVAGEVASGLGYPLRLGPGVAELLAQRTVAELRGIAAELDLAAPAMKKSLQRELAAFYADGNWIRRLVAGAPAETREVLDALTWHGPVLRGSANVFGGGAGPRYLGPEEWAVRRGLLHPDGWQQLAMPREVALALRGPDWRPPFDPWPPTPPPGATGSPTSQATARENVPAGTVAREAVAREAIAREAVAREAIAREAVAGEAIAREAVAGEAIAREAAAAAGALVDQAGAVLAAGPVALLKAGGVGTREQRRLARLIGADEAAVRLVIELAHGAGLLAATPEEVLPTEAYDDWVEASPPDRLPPLLVAWYRLPAMPWRDGAALTREPVGRLMPELRMELLSALAAVPADGGPVGEEYLAEAIGWHAPVLAGSFDQLAGFVGPLWSEAARLGLVAHGTLTELGRALFALDAEALGRAAEDLLDTAVSTAIFQADLTAVVPGPPSAELTRLLDDTADRESRGSASTWRFTAGSVRRALDSGHTAPDLLTALREVAAGAALPQPLEYLLADVARRHGRLRVRAVGCVLHAADPATLTELLASRTLAGLHLSQLAPTVLASSASRRDTLAALRSAGYAPMGEDASGEPLVERVDRRRASATTRHRPVARAATDERADPAALAEALLAAPEPAPVAPRGGSAAPTTTGTATDPTGSGTLAVLESRARGLADDERRMLAQAIDSGAPVRIAYVDADGRATVRVIEEIELAGAAIEAWCRLREDERMFLLDRIEAVAPA